MGKIKLPKIEPTTPISFNNINHGFRFITAEFLEVISPSFVENYNNVNSSSFDLKGVVCKVVQNGNRRDIEFFQLWKFDNVVILHNVGFKANQLLYIAQDENFNPSGSTAALVVQPGNVLSSFNSEMNICLFSIIDLSYVIDYCDEMVISWASINAHKSFYFDLSKSGPYYCLKCEGKFRPNVFRTSGIAETATAEPLLPTIILSAPCPPFWRPEITGLVDIRQILFAAIDHQES